MKGGSVKATYLHSMKTRFSSEFVGSNNKSRITNLTTTKMLESMDTWKGNRLGGTGVKVCLDTTMAMAMWRHCQTCNENLPEGELKELVLKTAKANRIFWSQLGAYIDNEHITLSSFSLLLKHILFLLSNQIVQICEDIFEPRCTASNTDIVHNKGVAAARFAWVTLQAHSVMEGFLKDKFRHHQAISGCFMRFLMRHMADQLAMDLKSTVDKLEALVKELKTAMANKVSAEMFNKLDSKVTGIACKPT